jgi:hypothetical protein
MHRWRAISVQAWGTRVPIVSIVLRWWLQLEVQARVRDSITVRCNSGAMAWPARVIVAGGGQFAAVDLVHQVLHGPAVIEQPSHAGVCGGALFNECYQTGELRLITLAQVI